MRFLSTILAALLCINQNVQASTQCTCALHESKSMLLSLTAEMEKQKYAEDPIMKKGLTMITEQETKVNAMTSRYGLDLDDYLTKFEVIYTPYLDRAKVIMDKLIIPMLKLKTVRNVYNIALTTQPKMIKVLTDTQKEALKFI